MSFVPQRPLLVLSGIISVRTANHFSFNIRNKGRKKNERERECVYCIDVSRRPMNNPNCNFTFPSLKEHKHKFISRVIFYIKKTYDILSPLYSKEKIVFLSRKNTHTHT